jgi:hypothetical protein
MGSEDVVLVRFIFTGFACFNNQKGRQSLQE